MIVSDSPTFKWCSREQAWAQVELLDLASGTLRLRVTGDDGRPTHVTATREQASEFAQAINAVLVESDKP